MSNDLIPTTELSVSKYGTAESFNDIANASAFLPRLQLFGSNSDAVKEGKFPMAHYGLVLNKDQFQDVGERVEILPISWRPKAMRLGVIDPNNPQKGGMPVNYFNPETEEFKSIQLDSEKPNSGCMFGPEFLVWVPAIRRFATFFMSSKTSRRQAPELRALLGRGAVLKVQLIKNNQYTWHGPVVTPCTTPFEVPPMEDIKRQMESFNNPEDSSVEFDPEKLEGENKEEGISRPR